MHRSVFKSCRATAGPGRKQRERACTLGTSDTKASECERAASARRAEPGSGRGGLAALPSLCLWLGLPSLPGRFPFSCRRLCTLRSLLMGRSLPEPSRSAPSLPVEGGNSLGCFLDLSNDLEQSVCSFLSCLSVLVGPSTQILGCPCSAVTTDQVLYLCFVICRMALAAPNSQGSLGD